MRPAVILKSDFIVGKSSTQQYKNYIRYIDRDEAKVKSEEHINYEVDEEEFEGYLDYLNRDKAKHSSSLENDEGLFNDKQDKLSRKERLEISKSFNEAQKNGAVLWRDVYSFDNEWLKENGFLKNGVLNEKEIKIATRNAMKKCFDEENLNEHGFWVGGIHYNTDNIHVHVASTEKINTREVIKYKRYDDNNTEYEVEEPKGKRLKRTEDKMKSSFINSLTNREMSLERMSQLRYSLHHSVTIDHYNLRQHRLLKEIQKQLPNEKTQWQYNNKNVKHIQPLIDQYTHNYMNKHHKKEFDEYKQLVKEDSEYNKALYGEGKKEKDRYKNSEAYKMKDLNSKMGNALLKELKEQGNKSHKSYEVKKEEQRYLHQDKARNIKTYNQTPLTKYDLYKIKNAFNNHRRKHEVENENQKLERKIERDNEMEL